MCTWFHQHLQADLATIANTSDLISVPAKGKSCHTLISFQYSEQVDYMHGIVYRIAGIFRGYNYKCLWLSLIKHVPQTLIFILIHLYRMHAKAAIPRK